MKTYRVAIKECKKTTSSSSSSDWKPGYVIITPTDGWMWLKDNNKITIRKDVITSFMMNSIVSGITDFIDFGCKYFHLLIYT